MQSNLRAQAEIQAQRKKVRRSHAHAHALSLSLSLHSLHACAPQQANPRARRADTLADAQFLAACQFVQTTTRVSLLRPARAFHTLPPADHPPAAQ